MMAEGEFPCIQSGFFLEQFLGGSSGMSVLYYIGMLGEETGDYWIVSIVHGFEYFHHIASHPSVD